MREAIKRTTKAIEATEKKHCVAGTMLPNWLDTAATLDCGSAAVPTKVLINYTVPLPLYSALLPSRRYGTVLPILPIVTDLGGLVIVLALQIKILSSAGRQQNGYALARMRRRNV